MAQTSRPQSPWQPPQNQENFMPPAKRQRLSPSPASPYAHAATPYASSPTYNNLSIPQNAFANSRTNGVSGLGSNQNGQQGAMGPPQRPAERASEKPQQKEQRELDVNELSDLVTSSGVNLKDEEDYLIRSYGSFTKSDATSGSSGLPHQTPGNWDLSSDSAGAIGGQRSTFRQGTPKQTEEEEMNEKRQKAARDVNAAQQWHLSDPFLWGASVRQRMQTIARERALGIPIDGLFDRIQDKPAPISGQKMQGQDGAAIQMAKAPSMLNKDTPIEPMLTLISLAAKERLRGLMEDAYGLARARQLGSDGVVPLQWSDAAIGEGAEPTKAISKTVTETAWEGANVAGGSSSPKIDNDTHDKPSTSQEPQTTTHFPHNPINAALASLIANDRRLEGERLKKRAARRAQKAQKAAAAATAGTTSASPTDTGTPAPDSASIASQAPKQTKKERENAARQEKNLTEEAAAREANLTASMQLNNKKYSWMTGGSAAKPPPKAAVNMRSGGAGAAQKKKEGLDAIEDRKFGSWREDGVDGKGVQLRDLIGVMETDGRERRSLQWAYMRLEGGLPEKNAGKGFARNTPGPVQREGSHSSTAAPSVASPTRALAQSQAPSRQPSYAPPTPSSMSPRPQQMQQPQQQAQGTSPRPQQQAQGTSPRPPQQHQHPGTPMQGHGTHMQQANDRIQAQQQQRAQQQAQGSPRPQQPQQNGLGGR